MTMTFYDWLQTTKHETHERKELAAELKTAAEEHPEVRKIDSFREFIDAAKYVRGIGYQAIGDGIWCEYCTATGHPINE